MSFSKIEKLNRQNMSKKLSKVNLEQRFSTKNTPWPVFQRKKYPRPATEDFHHLQAFLEASFTKKLHNIYFELSPRPVWNSPRPVGWETLISRQFHQRSKSSFCASRSLKRKKILTTWLNSYAFGSYRRKSCT